MLKVVRGNIYNVYNIYKPKDKMQMLDEAVVGSTSEAPTGFAAMQIQYTEEL